MNGDGTVDTTDLLHVAAGDQLPPQHRLPNEIIDVNKDDSIDYHDLLQVANEPLRLEGLGWLRQTACKNSVY